MAYLHYSNVRIAGIAAGVPKTVKNNLIDAENISSEYTPEDFVKTTGVIERHVSPTLCTSDLCYEAAEKLIADLQWDKSEIGALVFVSQTADYILPATSCILQDRLGLSKECYATDCALGCSGWVYGLSQVLGLISTGEIKKALLLAGDAKKRAEEISRKTAATLSLLLEHDTSGLLVILEGSSMGIKKALSVNEEFAKKFTEKIEVPIFSIDELVSLQKTLLEEAYSLLKEIYSNKKEEKNSDF